MHASYELCQTRRERATKNDRQIRRRRDTPHIDSKEREAVPTPLVLFIRELHPDWLAGLSACDQGSGLGPKSPDWC